MRLLSFIWQTIVYGGYAVLFYFNEEICLFKHVYVTNILRNRQLNDETQYVAVVIFRYSCIEDIHDWTHIIGLRHNVVNIYVVFYSHVFINIYRQFRSKSKQNFLYILIVNQDKYRSSVLTVYRVNWNAKLSIVAN